MKKTNLFIMSAVLTLAACTGVNSIYTNAIVNSNNFFKM